MRQTLRIKVPQVISSCSTEQLRADRIYKIIRIGCLGLSTEEKAQTQAPAAQASRLPLILVLSPKWLPCRIFTNRHFIRQDLQDQQDWVVSSRFPDENWTTQAPAAQKTHLGCLPGINQLPETPTRRRGGRFPAPVRGAGINPVHPVNPAGYDFRLIFAMVLVPCSGRNPRHLLLTPPV